MRMYRSLVLAIAAVGGVPLAPTVAFAHGLRAEVTVAEQVKLLAYFDDDTPAENAAVSVVDAVGNEVASGQTDERGIWAFAKPAPGRYVLRVKCIGHATKVDFTIEGEAPPVVESGWRLRKAVGLTVGLVFLLGTSAAYWFIRRQQRS